MHNKVFILLVSMTISGPLAAFSADATGKHSSMFDTRTCQELYAQASALEKEAYGTKNDYYTNTNARVAGVASMIFPPAIYYYGYAAYKDIQARRTTGMALQEIDAIRMRLAEKRCFDR